MIPDVDPAALHRIHAIGMVIYTYATIEPRIEQLLDWVEDVETWQSARMYEFHFEPRSKSSQRIWRATAPNRMQLRRRLADESWVHVLFGWGAGTIRQGPAQTGGALVTIKSRPQPPRGSERYRNPSFVYLEVHPSLLQTANQLAAFCRLGEKLWAIMDGCYGFIDVEANTPLHDDISRNVLHLLDSTVPQTHRQEYLAWKHIAAELDTKAWKAFWGNFLNQRHLERIGGPVHPMVHDNQLHQTPLDPNGLLITSGSSPLEYFEPTNQAALTKLGQWM